MRNSAKVLGTLLALLFGVAEALASPGNLHVPPGMAHVPPGGWQAAYSTGGGGVFVPGFMLDQSPVTNADYLAFVREQPAWQRTKVRLSIAEGQYLRHWAGDTALATPEDARKPVVNVSWFAAVAYCAHQGKQLPSTAEWERAAMASESAADGRQEPGFRQRILSWYARPGSAPLPPVQSSFRNFWGVWDLHGVVWEWTRDFAAAARGSASVDGTPFFCGAGAAGAADAGDYAAFMRHSMRSSLQHTYTLANLGFRCATPVGGLAANP